MVLYVVTGKATHKTYRYFKMKFTIVKAIYAKVRKFIADLTAKVFKKKNNTQATNDTCNKENPFQQQTEEQPNPIKDKATMPFSPVVTPIVNSVEFTESKQPTQGPEEKVTAGTLRGKDSGKGNHDIYIEKSSRSLNLSIKAAHNIPERIILSDNPHRPIKTLKRPRGKATLIGGKIGDVQFKV